MFQAVAKFQNDYKIYVSHKGIMEQRTMAAIDAAYRLKLSLNSIGQVISSRSMQRAVMEIIKGTPSGNTYEIVNRGKLKQGNIYQVYDPQGYEKILTYSVLDASSYIPGLGYVSAASKIIADYHYGNDATASTMELLNNATIDIAIVVVTGTVGKAVKIVKNVKKMDKAADAAKQVKKTETAARTKGGSFKYNLQFFASSKGAAEAVIWKGFSKGELAEHFAKHGNEFGDITQNQYLKLAKDFAAESNSAFRETKVGNFIIKYDEATRRVLVGQEKSREIRTFYKTDFRDEDPFEAAVNLAKELSGIK